MSILVIGNGFDIAHGLPTRYADFLNFLELYVASEEELEATTAHKPPAIIGFINRLKTMDSGYGKWRKYGKCCEVFWRVSKV